MLKAGKYRVRIGDLVIDDDDNMWLECELRERPYGTMMLPMGRQPLDEETVELNKIKDAIRHYICVKFGTDAADGFLGTRDDSWYWGCGHVGDDDRIIIYRSLIASTVKDWLFRNE